MLVLGHIANCESTTYLVENAWDAARYKAEDVLVRISPTKVTEVTVEDVRKKDSKKFWKTRSINENCIGWKWSVDETNKVNCMLAH